jgi:SulP family sulfate permease
MSQRLQRLFPILEWAPRYTRGEAVNDLFAAVIVTIMLVPQSLAYAMLAGLPPVVGLYASILPLVACAVFGASRGALPAVARRHGAASPPPDAAPSAGGPAPARQ